MTACARRSRAACRGQADDPAFLPDDRLRARRAAEAARRTQCRRARKGRQAGLQALGQRPRDQGAGAVAARRAEANVSWTENTMLKHKHADVGVAVSIPGGLITPVIRDACHKTLSQISNEMKDLAARAKNRKLKPEEYQGGTTAVSNLGMFGVKDFAAIQSAADLAVKRAVVRPGGCAMSVILAVDGRRRGVQAGRWRQSRTARWRGRASANCAMTRSPMWVTEGVGGEKPKLDRPVLARSPKGRHSAKCGRRRARQTPASADFRRLSLLAFKGYIENGRWRCWSRRPINDSQGTPSPSPHGEGRSSGDPCPTTTSSSSAPAPAAMSPPFVRRSSASRPRSSSASILPASARTGAASRPRRCCARPRSCITASMPRITG
jgi:hypothetical protein